MEMESCTNIKSSKIQHYCYGHLTWTMQKLLNSSGWVPPPKRPITSTKTSHFNETDTNLHAMITLSSICLCFQHLQSPKSSTCLNENPL